LKVGGGVTGCLLILRSSRSTLTAEPLLLAMSLAARARPPTARVSSLSRQMGSDTFDPTDLTFGFLLGVSSSAEDSDEEKHPFLFLANITFLGVRRLTLEVRGVRLVRRAPLDGSS